MTQTIEKPVIIIGAARSGTKFLRDTLASDPAFAAVPYDINYIWRTGNEGLAHDELSPASLTVKMRERIRKDIASLAGLRAGSGGKRLIEKTVSSGLRIPFIEAVFPDAQYVHIVRDGHAVIESSMRLWQAPPDKGALWKKLRQLPVSRYGYVAWFALNYLRGKSSGRSGGHVWGPRYDGIGHDIEAEDLLTVVARQWARTVEKASADLAQLPEARVFEIRYEDLVSSEQKVRELAEFVGAREPEKVLERYRGTLQGGNDEKWKQRLSAQEIETIETQAASALKRFGYV